MIEHAINDYLLWMISNGYAQSSRNTRKRVLERFCAFVSRHKIAWEAIFTPATLIAFQQQERGGNYLLWAVRGLWRYLFEQGRLSEPPQKDRAGLPKIYEEYLIWYGQLKSQHHYQIGAIRRILYAFHEYLEKHTLCLTALKIEDLDAFLAAYNTPFAPSTRQHNRSFIRGFLRYLYQERGIVKKDFAPLLIGAPVFAQAKPPKFLRPHEVQRLFSSQKVSSRRDLRAYAMLHLAYSLGLRPKEISLISLDDISFSRAEVSLRQRKSLNPITLPLPEATIKTIAAYLIGARPKSSHRALFLTLRPPYGPVRPGVVCAQLTACMRKANLASSAYWLRHTYAQNLLEGGCSIFEIKQMLGHERIQTSQRYIHIRTKLMREVLFDETL